MLSARLHLMKNKTAAAVGLLAVGSMLGYFAGRYSIRQPESATPRLPQSTRPGAQISQRGTELGTWTANLKIPGSVQVPDESPLIECDFEEPPDMYSGLMHVTVTSLTGRAYLVRLYVYGYDSENHRVSDAKDEFEIGAHESVLRQVLLSSQISDLRSFRFGQTFRVAVTLEE